MIKVSLIQTFCGRSAAPPLQTIVARIYAPYMYMSLVRTPYIQTDHHSKNLCTISDGVSLGANNKWTPSRQRIPVEI